MFCVLYQWRVKADKTDQFRETWRLITEAIFQQHGSLGSRMHQAEDGSWIAYAQWPDRQHWEHHEKTIGVELARSRQAECLHAPVSVLACLNMTDDLSRTEPFNKLMHEAPDCPTSKIQFPNSENQHNSGENPLDKPKTEEGPDSTVSAEAPGRVKMRIARPTDKMEEVVRFYRDGLGLLELGRFADHDGFDGVMIGAVNAPYHFEFTSCRGHLAGKAPTQDNLVVFYLPDTSQWQAALERMKSSGFQPVPSFNPYWDKVGRTFEDPDGYRVVLQNAAWKS